MDRYQELTKEELAKLDAYADFAESEWDRAYLSAEMALQRAPSEAEVEMELLRLFAQLGAKVEASEHG